VNRRLGEREFAELGHGQFGLGVARRGAAEKTTTLATGAVAPSTVRSGMDCVLAR